jgi:hypothetical protein
MTPWPTKTIAEITEKVAMGPFGSSIKVETFVESGVPVISGEHLRGVRLEDANYKFITEQHAEKLHNAVVTQGDVVFTHAGHIGQVAYIPQGSAHERYVISQRQFYARPDPTIVLPEYLAYYFKSPIGRNQLLANASATGVPSIVQPVTYLRTLMVPVPELVEQRRIAGVLDVLQDKIEHNERLRMLLLRVGRSIFTSACGTAVRLGDIAEIQKGLSYKGAGLVEAGGGLPMFNLGNFTTSAWCDRRGLKFYNGDHKARHQVTEGDLLVANTDLTQRRELLGQPLLVPAGIDRGLFTHHLFALNFSPENQSFRVAVYFGLQTRNFRDRAESFASGTTVAALPRDALLDFDCPMPTDLDSFTRRVELLIRRCWCAEEESIRLESIRDALLPKLVSGQLRVSEIYGADEVENPGEATATA